jgi:hypothetical protein
VLQTEAEPHPCFLNEDIKTTIHVPDGSYFEDKRFISADKDEKGNRY